MQTSNSQSPLLGWAFDVQLEDMRTISPSPWKRQLGCSFRCLLLLFQGLEEYGGWWRCWREMLRRSWWSLIGQGTNCPGQWCHCNISSGNGLENMYDISFLIAIINLIEEQMIEVAKAAAQPRHTWNPVLAFFFPFFGVSFCYRPSRQQLRRVENIKALGWHQSAIVFPGDGHCPGGVARSLNFKEF